MRTYDAIVIGGGPAGSAAAGRLAQAGKTVLVLEREKFPRFHVGESLIPYGNDVLQELGVWPKLEQGGFMRKKGAEFTLGNSTTQQRFWFRKNLPPRYAETFQVERARFDQLLLEHARELGAEVQEEAKVTQCRAGDEGVELDYTQGGESRTVHSRWVVDAGGRSAVLGRLWNLPKTDLGLPKRFAVFGHFTGVHRNAGEAAGHITIVRLENAWCWLIPLDEEKTSVGLVQALDDFKSQGATPAESFQAQMSAHAELRFRMKHAVQLGGFHTEGDYTYRHLQMAGPRWLLAGDAAGFIDPIFSSGVMVALRSGSTAAAAVLKADADGRALAAAEQRAYTREVEKMTGVFYRMIRMFYDRRAFEVFMNPNPWFDLPRAVNNLVAGNTHQDWSLRWRVGLFYFLCGLQRHVAISPRLLFREAVKRSQPVMAATSV